MSEYAVTGNDAGRGSLLKALGEAGFLIGLETNRYLLFERKYRLLHFLLIYVIVAFQ